MEQDFHNDSVAVVDSTHQRRSAARMGKIDGGVCRQEQMDTARVSLRRSLIQRRLAVRRAVVDIFGMRPQQVAQVELISRSGGGIQLRHVCIRTTAPRTPANVAWIRLS